MMGAGRQGGGGGALSDFWETMVRWDDDGFCRASVFSGCDAGGRDVLAIRQVGANTSMTVQMREAGSSDPPPRPAMVAAER